METLLCVLLIIIVIIVQGYVSELHNDDLHNDLVKKLEDLKSDNNDKQKPTPVDIDFMVESYKQRLWKNCKTTGDYAFVNACATAFREGIENTLDELDLRSFINKSKEKQDVQKPTNIYPIFKVGDIIRHKKEGFTCKIIGVDTEYRLSECNGTHLAFDSQDAYELVEQNPADKVQPKFKVGDWVVQEDIGVYKVIEICESWYEVVDNKDKHYSIGFDKEYMCHLWTIHDAKPGDILAEDTCIFIIKKLNNDLSAKIYCCLYDDGDFELNSMLVFDDTCTYPATKEQRDNLFRKITKEGYIWYSNSKELHKIKE